MSTQRDFNPSPSRTDDDNADDDVAPIPLRKGEPLSDPFAYKGRTTLARPPAFTLDDRARQVIRERWDGSTRTAAHIGEELGSVPAYKVIAWARELGLPNTVQPRFANGNAKASIFSDTSAPEAQHHPTPEPAPESEPATTLATTPATTPSKRGRGVKIPDQVKTQVIALRAQGIGQRTVAAQLGLSESTVYYIWKHHTPPTEAPAVAALEIPAVLADAPTPPPPPGTQTSAQVVAGDDGEEEVRPPHEHRWQPAILNETVVADTAASITTTGTRRDYRILHELLDLLPADGIWPTERRSNLWMSAFSAVFRSVTEIAGERAEPKEGGAK